MVSDPFLSSCSITKYRPTDQQELFNLCHASAHIVTEHAFGVLKKRFQILLLLTHYPLDIQACVPVALCIIHNFITLHHPSDHLDDDDDLMGGANEGHGSKDKDKNEDGGEDGNVGDRSIHDQIAC